MGRLYRLGNLLTISIFDNGKDNVVNIDSAVLATGYGRIVIDGNNNSVNIPQSTTLGDCDIYLGDGCFLEFGRDCFFHSVTVYALKCGVTKLGDGVSLNSRVRLLEHEAGKIEIGAGTLIANDVDISISDMHSIFDLSTGLRINPARDIIIGANVWIGQRCTILKGSRIGSGAVIGTGSIVSGEIEERTLAAGVPARIIRREIAWDRRLIDRLGS
jgi:acetyltransferase-like isoleucine patch superfamily enzyme